MPGQLLPPLKVVQEMGVWNRSLALLLAGLLSSGLTNPEIQQVQQVQQVTTHGGGPQRTNWYKQPSPPWLCLDWTPTLRGLSFTQPLLVRDNVYALGGNRLYRFDLEGHEVGSIEFAAGNNSHGQLTYHLGVVPDDDLLFVPTPGPPFGLAVIQPQTIIGTTTFTGDRLWTSQNGSYIVTAPLYLSELRAVVFGTASGGGDDKVWLVSTRGEFPRYNYPPDGTAGWVSGSPIQVASNQFAIGVKDGLRRLTIEAGTLVSDDKDLVKTLPAAPNGQVLSAVAGGRVDNDGFATVIYFVDKLGNLYKADTTFGTTIKDQWANLNPHPHVQGFNNSGPALDDKHAYLPIRWPLPDDFAGDAALTHMRPWYGSLTAIDKESGEPVWSQQLSAPDSIPAGLKPSWVNQEPIVVGGGRNADQSPKPRVVLAGDAGGRIWAWDGEGNPMPFALVDDQQLPIACASLEGPDAPGTVHYSAVAALTDRPHVVDGWSPESGVAIGLMFARDRLLTGVNEQNAAGEVQSRLVALRSGTNAWIQSLTFTQNGEQRPPERLNPAQPATVKVTAAWSVTGAGRILAPLSVYAGWPDQHIDSAQVKTITPTGPLGQQTLEFQLPARTGTRQGTVVAVLNPGLLIRRQPKEEGAAPIPVPWGEDFAQTATDANLMNRGEVLVGDNLVTQAVGGSAPPVAKLWVAPTEACTGQAIKYTTSYWDPQRLPIVNEEGDPTWPPPARFETPTRVNIRYRAQNAAGAWSEWAEKTVTVKDCTKPPPPPPSVAFDVAFDPTVGHRGHRINMDITVHRKAEIDAHKIKAFNVAGVTVTLPGELRNLRACVPYQPQCWEAPNDDIRASGSDLVWHYTFDLPAPGTTPEDGDYPVTVAANGTYTWDHWHAKWQWHAQWVDICNTDPVTGAQTCQRVDQGEWVDEGSSHEHTESWSATQQGSFAVKGGHQFVHPATDHD